MIGEVFFLSCFLFLFIYLFYFILFHFISFAISDHIIPGHRRRRRRRRRVSPFCIPLAADEVTRRIGSEDDTLACVFSLRLRRSCGLNKLSSAICRFSLGF